MPFEIHIIKPIEYGRGDFVRTPNDVAAKLLKVYEEVENKNGDVVAQHEVDFVRYSMRNGKVFGREIGEKVLFLVAQFPDSPTPENLPASTTETGVIDGQVGIC